MIWFHHVKRTHRSQLRQIEENATVLLKPMHIACVINGSFNTSALIILVRLISLVFTHSSPVCSHCQPSPCLAGLFGRTPPPHPPTPTHTHTHQPPPPASIQGCVCLWAVCFMHGLVRGALLLVGRRCR